MTPANIAATLAAVQQAVLDLLAASTTLASPITATDTAITVAGDADFPAPNFYVYIGSEILQVTAIGRHGEYDLDRGRRQLEPPRRPRRRRVGDAHQQATGRGRHTLAVAANGTRSANTPSGERRHGPDPEDAARRQGRGKTLLAVLEGSVASGCAIGNDHDRRDHRRPGTQLQRI